MSRGNGHDHEARFEGARRAMVAEQIARRGVRDPSVLRAMSRVPRERFVPPESAEFAYDDRPLPIGCGQTISQPYVVALMTKALRLGPDDRVLEIGTGSGYAAAVLAECAREVYSIERHEGLAEVARARLAELGYTNVQVRVGDGTLGWPEAAPFDAIVATAGGPVVPRALKCQLAVGGRLVIPVGALKNAQTLVRVVRTFADRFDQDDLGGVAFVPLIGAQGWQA